jgi:predicted RNase H-like HicB family nuclease
MIIEYDYHDKYFIVALPELPGCMADGKTIIKAINMALKAKSNWIEIAYKLNWKVPLPKGLKEVP